MTEPRTATLHRMVLPDHVCPFGIRAKQLLQAEGYDVDDRILRDRDAVQRDIDNGYLDEAQAREIYGPTESAERTS